MTFQKQNIRGYAIWGLCALFFLYEFFLRTVMGTLQESIIADLRLTSVEYAVLSSSAYLIIYGLMQIPVGIIVDRYGLKKSLFVGAIACAISSVGLFFVESYVPALLLRMLMGFGSSFGFVCVLFSVYEYLPRKYSALFIGVSQFVGTVGPIIAAGPLGNVIEAYQITWRTLFVVFGGVGVLFALASLFVIESKPTEAVRYYLLKRPKSIGMSLLKKLLKKEPWFIAFFSAFSYFSIEYLAETEGISLLVSKGISHSMAAYFVSISWVGYAIGCPLAGFLSDVFQRRKPIMFGLALIGFLALLIITYTSHTLIIGGMFFCLGMSASAQSVGFAAISEEFPKDFLGLGLGLNNAMITTFVALNAPFLGWMWGIDGHTYLPHQPQQLFLSLTLITLLGVILVGFFIRETFCKSQREFTLLTV